LTNGNENDCLRATSLCIRGKAASIVCKASLTELLKAAGHLQNQFAH